jgi:RNA polymerase sigma-70 factor (ECF subfamily)
MDPVATHQARSVEPGTEDPAPRLPPTFRAVFEAESSYVLNSLRRLGVFERDLDDLTHDVFLAVHLRFGDYDPARPIRPWLFAFAARVAAAYRRRARHRLEVIDGAIEAVDEQAGAADARVAAQEARRLVIQALDAVEFDRRTVLVMHDIDGESMPEIARTLSIQLNTGYSRLRLAREEFETALKRLQPRRDSR